MKYYLFTFYKNTKKRLHPSFSSSTAAFKRTFKYLGVSLRVGLCATIFFCRRRNTKKVFPLLSLTQNKRLVGVFFYNLQFMSGD
jgi:hypothetical protein